MSSKYLTPLTTSYINKFYSLYGFTEDIDKEKFLPIQLSNIDISVGSALRRIFMSEIANAAFADANIKILANTSQYHREVLIQRMGYITIDSNNLDLSTESLNDLIFLICDPNDPEQALKNNTNSILMVNIYKYLYIQRISTQAVIPTSELIPYDSKMLTLNPGEEIQIVMRASSGLGRQDPRWQSSITMYKYGTDFDEKDHLENNEELMLYIGHEKKQPSKIILTIESIGKLKSNTVIKRGLQAFQSKLDGFKKQLQIHEKSDLISIQLNENIQNLVKLKIINEDHTLGNVLETACFNKLKELISVTVKSNNKGVTTPELEMELMLESLSAYRKPHPLDNYIEFSVRTPQKYDLVFPKGEFDEVTNPSLRLILLAVEEVERICETMLEEAKVLD